MNLKKSCWWGPFPNELDGGAIVNYYLLKMMNYLEPNHSFHCIPKVIEQVKATALPFASFYGIKTEGLGKIPPEICNLMSKKDIPLLVMFHIPWEHFPIVDKVHDIGGKVLLHQTVHWDDDVLFQSDKLNEIDHWVTPTDFAKRTLASVGKVDGSKMTTIPHGVNLEKFYPHETSLRRNYNIKDDEIVITWVGRCQMTKGAHVIIPIIRKLLEEYPKVHFFARAGAFAGIYKSRELNYILTRMADRLDRFYYISSWCETGFMEELMAMTDIGLCVSGHEGFSLPPLEWMACGKPVALSAISNHIELFGGENYKYGVLMETSVDSEIVNVYPSNPEGTMVKVPKPDLIYGTLKWLIENPDERKIMGKNGMIRAKQHYYLGNVADKWLNLMDSMFPKDESMDARMQDRMLIK